MSAARWLIIEIADRLLALPEADVDAVHPAVWPQAVAGLPPPAIGVCAVRGRPMPVIDARARLGLLRRTLATADAFVATRCRKRRVLWWVDGVRGVATLAPERLSPSAELSSQGRWLAGVAAGPDGLIVLHDPDAFLAEAELAGMEQALAEAEPG